MFYKLYKNSKYFIRLKLINLVNVCNIFFPTHNERALLLFSMFNIC